MPEEVVILIVMGMAFSLAWGVMGTVRTIIIKRMESRTPGDGGAMRTELQTVQRRMDALEDGVLGRVQELEERVDFAERLLARGRRVEHREG